MPGPSCRESARTFLVVLAGAIFAAAPEARGGYSPGFEESIVCEGFFQPTAIAFVRPKILLVAEKSGRVYAVRNGAVRPSPVLVLPAAVDRERGLNGIAVEPRFRRRGYVYVHYTVDSSPKKNRVSRFLVSRTEIGPEEVVVDGLWSGVGIHNSGCLRFAPDGSLFFSAGDGGQLTHLAQDLSVLNGKLCRILPDGSIPPGNPFAGLPGARPEIWAYGFRNPWRFAIDPATSIVHVNDVGSAFYEEVNRVWPGQNFGWPSKEGPREGPGMTLPLISYAHGDSGAAVTGGAFYRGSEYPPAYNGNYFYMDFIRGFLKRAELDGSGAVVSIEDVATDLVRPVDLVLGPDQKLYWLSYDLGSVQRIDYVGDENRKPVLRIDAAPTAGTAPLDVSFSFSRSYDPDGDPLSFRVEFGDGAVLDTTDLAVAHRYPERRVYDAVVTATDGRGGIDRRSARIDASNEPPLPVISAPADGSLYAAGDVIPFSGFATDPEDGALSGARLSWTIVLRHDEHTHPFLGPLVGQHEGVFRVPRQGETSTNVGYEVRLDATDTSGVTAGVSVVVRPKTAVLRLLTDPPGLAVTLNGTPIATPADVDSVVGFGHLLDAPSPQTGPGGQVLSFQGWADSTDLVRRFHVPEEGAELTAIFR